MKKPTGIEPKEMDLRGITAQEVHDLFFRFATECSRNCLNIVLN